MFDCSYFPINLPPIFPAAEPAPAPAILRVDERAQDSKDWSNYFLSVNFGALNPQLAYMLRFLLLITRYIIYLILFVLTPFVDLKITKKFVGGIGVLETRKLLFLQELLFLF